jgi:hypothetical protein|tara:strand:- start:103 stop:504 length:402 start_codon:yes stop_codon:yes gene_type:complete
VPAERVSKGFKDISASFQVNPLNDDLIPLLNANSIARSIRNLVFTSRGDIPFNPVLGSRVGELLFEPMDQITSTALREEIKDTIDNFEPRVKLEEVEVVPDYDEGQYDIIINYIIIGIDVLPQQLSFALVPTR